MENINKLFTEEQVNEVSQKILKSSISKITEELSNSFYQEMDNYLFEHFENAKQKIENTLISEITEEFIKNPTDYKYAKLREKLFLENKETLIKTLTDEAIFRNVENIMLSYTHKNHDFGWMWKDAIIRIIAENWHTFKDDERVNNRLLRQIENLKLQISNLQQKINELEEQE